MATMGGFQRGLWKCGASPSTSWSRNYSVGSDQGDIQLHEDYLYAVSYSSNHPGGILRSSDFGESWELVYNTSYFGNPSCYVILEDLIIYVSQDGKVHHVDMTSWTEVNNYDLGGSVYYSDMIHVNGSLYLAGTDGIMRSDDMGQSWINIGPDDSDFHNIKLQDDVIFVAGVSGLWSLQLEPAVLGCTDAAACNYNPNASSDDGSCTYPGCTDAAAVNYDATAGCDDGSCVVVNACAEWDLLFVDEPLAASYTLGRAVAALPDGRFAVAGADYAEIGDGMLGIVSSTGSLLEYHIAGDIGDVEEYAEDVVVCGAGGYAIAGSRENYLGDTSNDFWLARFDETGAVLWTQSYGTFAVEVAVEVHEMDNGNFVLGGYQTDGNGYAYVVMTEANGDVLWEATYEQPGEDHQFLDMEVTSTGEIVLAGAAIIEAQPFPSPIAVAFDTAGNFLWETIWSEPGSWRGVASSPEGELRFFGNDTFATTALLGTRDASTGVGAVQEVLGGSLIDGLHASNGWVAIGSNASLQEPSTGATPDWILGLDDAGSITWSCAVGASIGNTIEVQDVTRSANGEWLVAGIADGQSAFVERFASNGNIEVLGCTSTLACNYTPSATFEDGTCVFPGCTDAIACNYNANAGCDDGSCTFPNPGEDCSGACFEDSDDDGVCDENEIPGCTVDGACNYMPEATENDGSCFFANSVFDCEGNCQLDLNENGICDQLETGACSGPDCCGDGTLWDPAQGICIAFDQCPADVNEDGVVDAIDVLDLIGGYGSVCP